VIGLDEILEHRVGEVLSDPTLLIPMLKYYSKLYLSGGTPRTCASSHKQYYIRLQQDGLERLKKITMAKYQLKPGIVLTFCGQTYNQGTMTDEIAVNIIARSPKLIAQFNIKEDAPVKEAPKAEAPVNEVQVKDEIKKIKHTRKPKK
jgi:hypothetical protein